MQERAIVHGVQKAMTVVLRPQRLPSVTQASTVRLDLQDVKLVNQVHSHFKSSVRTQFVKKQSNVPKQSKQ